MISVVIPTYNRGEHLPQVTEKLIGYLKANYDEFEVIYVDDGSADQTQKVLKDLTMDYGQVTAIILASNAGQQNATLAGIRQAKYPQVLTMDDDLRYGLEGIHQLVDQLSQGYDVVYGIPKEDKTKAVRTLGTWLKEGIFRRFCAKPKGLRLSSFRVMHGGVIDYIKEDQSKHVYISARTLQYTNQLCHVAVPCEDALVLPTTYTFRKLLLLLIHVFSQYSSIGRRLNLNHRGQQYCIKEVYS